MPTLTAKRSRRPRHSARGRLLWAALVLAGAPHAGAEALHFPVDCTLGRDCVIQQYVDRDPGSGATDYTCGPLTYDNHSGTDIRLTNLEAMRQGVNVLSASAGVVTAIRDGVPDTARRTEYRVRYPCGNGVLVRRADGWKFQYCHLKKDTVAVRKGDTVAPGTVLGQVGMSGRTEFPHLHLTIRDQAGRTIDPFDARQQGQSCRLPDRETLWAADIDTRYRPGGALQAGFADHVPSYGAIKDGQASARTLPRDAEGLVFWAEFFGLRRDDIIALEVRDPGGRLFVEDRFRMDRTRAVQFRAAGRSIGPWSAGTYTGRASLIRDGDVLSTIEATLDVR